MNTISMFGDRATQRLHPLSLLAQLTTRQANGCLQVTNGEVSWDLYLAGGRLLYASSSADPFERLDRHLRRLSTQVFSLVSAMRVQVRLLFENPVEDLPIPDYQAICWLVDQQHLTTAEASLLIEELAKEVIEALLPVRLGHCQFLEMSQLDGLPHFCQLDLRPIIEHCQDQLRRRQVGDRPMTSNGLNGANRSFLQTVSNDTVSNLTPVLNPYAPIVDEKLLRSPKQQQTEKVVETPLTSGNWNVVPSQDDRRDEQPPPAPPACTTHRIACIDDSPTVLQVIKTYLESLDEQSFAVTLINDPVKALMQIVRNKPDLILLDVTMPGLDGYELCSLLRRHPHCKQTPIIMVTGNTGLVDRARAKLVGASGYLTKPFTQSDIIKTVFKYLSIS
ncbi:MAG: response regulator [Synechococcales bacterium]|nr:response regulator [Synechococcales bacterium]